MEKGTLGVVIRVSRLMCIAPYMRRAKDGVSKPLFVLSLIVVTSIGLFVVIRQILNFKTLYDENNANVLKIFHLVGVCLAVTITMLGLSISAKRIAHMVQSLGKLQKIQENIRYSGSMSEDRRARYLVLSYMSAIFAMHLTDCFIIKTNLKSVVYEICIAIVRTWVELLLLQVVSFAERVLATLRIINDTLHQLSIDLNVEGENKFMNNKRVKPKLAFVYSREDAENYENVRCNTNITHTVTSDVIESNEYTIRCLSKSYTIICEIIRDTTDVNGLLLIMILLSHMLQLEMLTYHIVLWMSCENNFSFESFFLTYHGLGHALGMFLLMDTFHRTHEEMERTELLVRCLKYENDPSLAMNNELDLFQRILVLENTTYSPLHMCTLDRSLLVKVFGMLISYLVIIITYGPRIDSTTNKKM